MSVNQRPHATHPKDTEFFRGVIAALSILKSSRSIAAARLAIAKTVGEEDLLKRAKLDGTIEWAGLDKLPGLARAEKARKKPRK